MLTVENDIEVVVAITADAWWTASSVPATVQSDGGYTIKYLQMLCRALNASEAENLAGLDGKADMTQECKGQSSLPSKIHT